MSGQFTGREGSKGKKNKKADLKFAVSSEDIKNVRINLCGYIKQNNYMFL